MKHDAKSLMDFLKVREEAGLPQSTPSQMKRAMRLVQSNPTMRQHSTPLGMELLALSLPLDRHERRAIEKERGFKYQPERRRGEHLRVEAPADNVRAFLDAVQPEDEQAWVASVARATGRLPSDVARMTSRVRRFFAKPRSRVPAHIQRMAVDLSAIAQGLKLMEAR